MRRNITSFEPGHYLKQDSSRISWTHVVHSRVRAALCFNALLCAAFADPVQAAPVWAYSRHITFLYPASNVLMVNVDGAALNTNSGCSPNRLNLANTTGNYEVMASSFLVAFSQNNLVDIYYEDANAASCTLPVYQFIVYK